MKRFSIEEIADYIGSLGNGDATSEQYHVDMPTISVVVPSYNQAGYLERTLISIINQNYPCLELIVMDGGSTDDSVDIIRRYERHIDYWTSEKDNGQSDAIRKGFKRAKGDILAWLNSDDIYLPDALVRVGKTFNKHQKADVVYGNEYIIDENDGIIKERRVTSGLRLISKLGFIAGNFGFFQPAAFWRRELYEKVEGVDTKYRFTMDNDLFARFDLAGARYLFIREFLAGFRIHSDSKTTNLQDVAKKELAEVYAKYGRPKPLNSFLKMNMYRTIKSFLYVTQGDGPWLLKGLAGRVFKGEKFNL